MCSAPMYLYNKQEKLIFTTTRFPLAGKSYKIGEYRY